MSGPKGGSYRVETAKQREARLLRDAKAHYARAQIVWAAAQSRMDATAAVTGTVVPCRKPAAVRAGADSAAYSAAATALEAAAAAAVEAATAVREAHADARYAAQLARITAPAASTPAEPVHAPRRTSVPADTIATPTPSIDRVRTGERVQRRVAALAGVDHDTDRVALLVADIANAHNQSRVDLLISELDAILRDGQAAAARAAAAAQTRADLEQLAARIAGIDREPVDAVRQQIARLIAAEATALPADLSAQVDQLIAESDADDDRHQVIASMRHALEELGYTLGPEFDTQLESSRGTTIVSGPTAGYGVKVRLEPDRSRFSAQAVKSDAVISSTEKDADVERQFCTDFAEIVAMVGADGVALDIDIDVEPGASKVQEVAAEHVAASGRRRAQRRSAERERHQS